MGSKTISIFPYRHVSNSDEYSVHILFNKWAVYSVAEFFPYSKATIIIHEVDILVTVGNDNRLCV